MAPRYFQLASSDANLQALISVTILSAAEFVIKTRVLAFPERHHPRIIKV